MTESEPPPSTRTVWLFHGEHAKFASGVFDNEDEAMRWIERHRLTGVLSEYVVGDGTYDLALAAGKFRHSKPHHGTPTHVAGFSPSLAHVHVADGVRA